MANIVDYIKWRGDLPLHASPFNEVDALILTQLSMIDFDGIVPAFPETGGITVETAAKRYFADHEVNEKSLGLIIPEEIIPMFRMMSESDRYKRMKLCSYVNHVNTDREQQFSALTVKTGDGIFITFRGTDDTLVGWKEDFNKAEVLKNG